VVRFELLVMLNPNRLSQRKQ